MTLNELMRKIPLNELRAVLWVLTDLTPNECEDLSERAVKARLRALVKKDNELIEWFEVGYSKHIR